MHIIEALRSYQSRVEARLSEKTSWGRVELKAILDEEYRAILEKIVVDSMEAYRAERATSGLEDR